MIASLVLYFVRRTSVFSPSGPVLGLFFSFPTPFFLYPSQDFKLIGLSWSSKYEGGGKGGRWIGSWANCIHSNLFWWSLSYWLGKGVPVTNSIEGWSFSLILVEGRLIKHANWNKPYMIKPTLPTSWLASKKCLTEKRSARVYSVIAFPWNDRGSVRSCCILALSA